MPDVQTSHLQLIKPNTIFTMYIVNSDFNLDYTLDCGQVFRWKRTGEWWEGVVCGHVIRTRQVEGVLEVQTGLSRDRIREYFRLDDDMQKIYDTINRDAVMDRLVRQYRGLHVIRQQPWECLISYMASSCKSIPNIKDSISNLCIQYGEDLGGHYSFPDPEILSQTTEQLLRQTKLGFRAGNILEVAKLVERGELDLEVPFELEYDEAKRLLMKVRGIGPKIADCVLLFAYDKLEAFPADTHILSVMQEHYGRYLAGPKNKAQDVISEFARSYFGPYAGYAQQYLYYSRISSDSSLPVHCGKL
ncbi:MAG: DNA glycosylase [Methanosarcinales archaeon]|nr:DNA glycosylase [ANME-2 cluster archaeon]MDW7776432.1 DNA glycosylase [Methanosarcinales archaeon]